MSPAEMVEGLMKLGLRLERDLDFKNVQLVNEVSGYLMSLPKQIDRLQTSSNFDWNKVIVEWADWQKDFYANDVEGNK